MRIRPLDVAAAVSVVVATVGPPAMSGPWPEIALAATASVPVLWVRRHPLRVGGVVGLATTALAALYTAPVLPLGPLLAVYVIATDRRAAVRAAAVALTAVGVTVSLVVPGEDLATYRYLAMAYVAAYALGASTRARRAQAVAVAEERRAAEARERTRIARDMHDIITHSVGMMVVQAEAGPLVVRGAPERAVAVFDAIADTGRGAVARLREALTALRSPGVADLAELTSTVTGAVLEVAGEPRPVPAEVDATLYRVVQESLTNVLRHAAARTVRVRLHWRERVVSVDVVDDGRGPAGVPGFGLVGMRERVAACGGTLRTGPGPGGVGFAVRATLPIG